jgi:hypothetical protein
MARSDVDKIIELLSKHGHQTGRSRILEHYGWDSARLDRALTRAASEDRQLETIRGGHVVYRGTERGTRGGVPLYRDVTRALHDDNAKRLLGWTRATAFDTARGGASGEWSRPDLVIAAHPIRKASAHAPKSLHAIEIEQWTGFKMQSVYQAHSQARGADFAWVFCPASALAKSRDSERIVWAAEKLGIGLVTFERAGNRSTYRRELKARSLDANTPDHGTFVTTVLETTHDDPRLW